PDIGGVLYLSSAIRIADLAALVDTDAARHGLEPLYWPKRLATAPRPQLVYVHGYWTAVTGLMEPAMKDIGYRRLCDQPLPADGAPGDWRSPPQLYVRDDCRGQLPASTRARLRRLCERGHRHSPGGDESSRAASVSRSGRG